MTPNARLTLGDENGYLTPVDFQKIYELNLFGSEESRSGQGSTLEQTEHIRKELGNLFADLGVRTVVDIPCGDFNWMQRLDLSNIKYIGGDIVDSMVDNNNKVFGAENIQFRVMNILSDPLPKADIVLCRDCLVHMRLDDGIRAIDNIKKSGAAYILATTFPALSENTDAFRFWRPVNLEKAPFDLGAPIILLNEKCTENLHGKGFPDKSLGLWKLEDL
ncbi:hypothetical protein GQ53DRAFT_818250 [Thozetella sp. PMI_491]|nr:hypothetical protein GQ53DRAFT_818250 [Thozetella sp. PMI_491]